MKKMQPIDPLFMSDVADALEAVCLGQSDCSGLHDRILGNTSSVKTRDQAVDLGRVRSGMQAAEWVLIRLSHWDK